MSPDSESVTPLAVALGELRGELKHIGETVSGMDGKLDRALADISDVKRDLAVTQTDVDGLLKREDDRNRRKPPWTAIAALTISIPAAFSALKGWLGF